jgi:hypothetical protein
MASSSMQKQKSRNSRAVRPRENKLKFLTITMSNRYSIFEAVPHKLEAYFSKIQATYNIDFDKIHRSLTLYLFSNTKITHEMRRDLSIELRMDGKPTRADILTRLSKVIIEKSYALAKFYVSDIVDLRDHQSLGIANKRKYPNMFLKFLAIMRQVERTDKIPNSSSYAFIDKNIIKSTNKISSKEGKRNVFAINNKFEFVRELESLTELFDRYDPSLNLDFNLIEEIPNLTSYLSCLIEKDENGYRLIHSDKIPTAFEAAESMLFDVNYKLEGIPSRLQGRHIYNVPKDLEDYVFLEFWKEFFATKGVNAIASLEVTSVPYDVESVREKMNITEQRSGSLDSSSTTTDKKIISSSETPPD